MTWEEARLGGRGVTRKQLTNRNPQRLRDEGRGKADGCRSGEGYLDVLWGRRVSTRERGGEDGLLQVANGHCAKGVKLSLDLTYITTR